MSNSATKTPLLVKKAESKKGSLWHDFANRRIIKQHGGFDIPDDDLHAVHKFVGPILSTQATTEETTAVLSDIQKAIENLKEKENQSRIPSNPPEDFKEFFDEPKPQNPTEDDDNEEF
jgi:hypothetical protein